MADWGISAEDTARILAEQNPWHRAPHHVPGVLLPSQRRPLARLLYQTLINPPLHRFHVVIGPRRVGKTVALYQTIQSLLDAGIPAPRLWWMHLAHPALMSAPLDTLVKSASHLAGATQESPAFLFLDEVTYAADWDQWLKVFYDERRPVRIIGTSSSTAALRQGRVESGVGRWEEHALPPCLFDEYLQLAGRPVSVPIRSDLYDTLVSAAVNPPVLNIPIEGERLRFMLVGGFPELLLAPWSAYPATDVDALRNAILASQRSLREDAVQKALYVDIPQVFGVDEPLKLEKLLYVLAGQVAGLISATSLASTIGLSTPTLDKYLGYLERAFLIFQLPNYGPSEETVQRRGRKLYFTDTAVRNAALQRGTSVLENPVELGALIENLVASHLHAYAQHAGHRLYHWRQGNYEVDFVLDHPSGPIAIEVASSHQHTDRGLMALCKRHPAFVGRCFLVAPQIATRPGVPSKVHQLDLDTLLLLVGAHTTHALHLRLGPAHNPR